MPVPTVRAMLKATRLKFALTSHHPKFHMPSSVELWESDVPTFTWMLISFKLARTRPVD